MERSTTSDELKAFIRSNIQQILNGVNNNVMEEKDGIDYLCVTIDRLLYIINRGSKSSIFLGTRVKSQTCTSNVGGLRR